MSGMSARANWSMKSASAPGATTYTPSAAAPGRGFARPAASLATSFDVPPPMDNESEVSASTASRIRRAVAASGSAPRPAGCATPRSEEHTSELQSRENLVCRLLLEKKKKKKQQHI